MTVFRYLVLFPQFRTKQNDRKKFNSETEIAAIRVMPSELYHTRPVTESLLCYCSLRIQEEKKRQAKERYDAEELAELTKFIKEEERKQKLCASTDANYGQTSIDCIVNVVLSGMWCLIMLTSWRSRFEKVRS